MELEKKRHMPNNRTVTITLSYTFNLDEFIIDTLPEDCDHCPVGYRCNHDTDDYSQHVDCGIVYPIERGHRPDTCKLKSIEQYLDEQQHRCKDCDHCIPIPMGLTSHCGWCTEKLVGLSMCTRELKVVNPAFGCSQFAPKPVKEEPKPAIIPEVHINPSPYDVPEIEKLMRETRLEPFPGFPYEVIIPSLVAYDRIQQLKIQHGVCCATCQYCQTLEPVMLGPDRIVSVDLVLPKCALNGHTIGAPKANLCERYSSAYKERVPHFSECHCVDCALFTEYQGTTGRCVITDKAVDAGQGACENFLPDDV